MKKLLMITLLLIATSAVAKQEEDPIIEIGRVETQEVTTPVHEDADTGEDTIQVTGMPLTLAERKKWFRVAVEYETHPEWIDRLTLEFYVLMPNPEKGKSLFKGVVSYVDIPEGREHSAEMYMHFNSYKRHYGRGKIRTAVLAKINEEIIAVDEDNSLEDPWWEDDQAFRCGLLNRRDSPFHVVNMEKYEAQDPCAWK